jgi:regulator of protease activity HflC (stomatin/prohibitin superfamily)
VITDWYTFSTKTQTLAMTAEAEPADRETKDDLEFKTRDGNDVGVDVTILYRLDPQKALLVLTRGAKNDWEIKEKIVRPMARAIPRDCLNELTSEDIYTDKKFKAADCAVAALNKVFEPIGLVCENVTLADHRFHPAYQTAINDKKVFDQQVNTNRSAAESVMREWETNLEKTRGDVEQRIAAEKGQAEQMKLDADAYYFARQKEAEALLAEKTASAQGIRKLNQAMSGSGGRTRVKLKIAQALKGKRIILVPSGAGGAAIQRLDLNTLIDNVLAREATEGRNTP